MINPDEIPWYWGIPAIVICWGTWAAIRVAEAREKMRRMRDDFEGGRMEAQPHAEED